MNNIEKIWATIFKFELPECDGCNMKLSILEVEQANETHLILHAAPHGEWGSNYTLYDIGRKQTVGGGVTERLVLMHGLEQKDPKYLKSNKDWYDNEKRN
jgi:hypothetical protein